MILNINYLINKLTVPFESYVKEWKNIFKDEKEVIIKVIVKDGDWEVFADYIAKDDYISFFDRKNKAPIVIIFRFYIFFSILLFFHHGWCLLNRYMSSNTLDWIYDVQNTPFLVGKTFVL